MLCKYLYVLYISFSLFAKQRERNVPKERENTQMFTMPFGHRTELLLPVNRHSIAGYCTSYTPAVTTRACCIATVASIRDFAKQKEKIQPSVARMSETFRCFLFFCVYFLFFASEIKKRKYTFLNIKFKNKH